MLNTTHNAQRTTHNAQGKRLKLSRYWALLAGLLIGSQAAAELITYSKSGDIYSMSSLTASPAKLTALGSIMDHRVSPDGSKIVFTVTVTAGVSYDVFVMNADGSGQTKIATKTQGNHGWGYGVVFSPDGRQVLYSSGDGLWKIGIDGSGKTLVAANPSGRTWRHVDWHANDKILALSIGGWAYNAEVRLMNSDGSNQSIVVPDEPGALQNPRFSPDGQSFLYTYDPSGNEESSGRQVSTSVYVKPLSGGTATRVTFPSNVQDYAAAFSPDGGRIMYSHCSTECALMAMNVDGSQQQTILQSGVWGTNLNWLGNTAGICAAPTTGTGSAQNETEDNGSIASANAIRADGSTVSASWSSASTDVDLYKFTTTQGDTFDLDLTANANAGEVRLEVSTENAGEGHRSVYTESFSLTANTAKRISIPLGTAQTYYLNLRGWTVTANTRYEFTLKPRSTTGTTTGTTPGTSGTFDQGYSAGVAAAKAACLANPASCGITTTGTTTGTGTTSTGHASYDPLTGLVRIPYLDVPNVFGSPFVYSLDLNIVNASPLRFELKSARQVQ